MSQWIYISKCRENEREDKIEEEKISECSGNERKERKRGDDVGSFISLVGQRIGVQHPDPGSDRTLKHSNTNHLNHG